MRIAGFNLGSRYTLDDLCTASDILHGELEISLGSLDDEEEQLEREVAKVEMLEELENFRQEMRASRGVEKGAEKEVEDEVTTSDIDSGVKNEDAVEKIINDNKIDTSSQLNLGVEGEQKSTENKTGGQSEDLDSALEFSDDEPEEDTVEEDEDYFSVDDDDLDFIDFGDDKDNEEPEAPIKEEVKPKEIVKHTIVEKPRPVINKNQAKSKVEERQQQKRPPIRPSGKPQSTAERPVSEIGKQPKPQGRPINKQVNPIEKPGNTPRSKVNPVVNPQHRIPQKPVKPKEETKKKVDYSELTIKEINDMYLRKFLIDNGVRKGPVPKEKVIGEFGADIVNKLINKGYILKRGSGFIMGI